MGPGIPVDTGTVVGGRVTFTGDYPSGLLLQHFENRNTGGSPAELDLDEAKALVRVFGFELAVTISLRMFYPLI